MVWSYALVVRSYVQSYVRSFGRTLGRALWLFGRTLGRAFGRTPGPFSFDIFSAATFRNELIYIYIYLSNMTMYDICNIDVMIFTIWVLFDDFFFAS